MKKLYVFDLDGTLAESKQPLSEEMAGLLARLIEVVPVAVISGGALTQFLKQVVSRLPEHAALGNLYLLPTSGAALYEYRHDDWKKVYEERIPDAEAKEAQKIIEEEVAKTGLIDLSIPAWGERIEFRGSQVTLSALGQHAPLALKKEWDPDHAKRRILQSAIAERLPHFEVSIGGSTSIDVTKRGIDKAYGLHRLCERLKIRESDVLYVGDELEAGGNDEAVYKTEAETKAVRGPIETAAFIESLLN